jgi:linoleoyl-CoA desaturase
MTTSPPVRAHFPRDAAGFHAALRRGAAAYFEASGRSRGGGARMHLKTATILLWFAASYAALLGWGGTSAWAAVAATVSLALATAGIGFAIMHDANHGAYSSSPLVNRGWALALDFIGASSYVWRFKHNVQHHTYANIVGLDLDVDAEPFLRLAPPQRRRPYHRLQHLYAWPLYGVLALKWWFLDDVVDLARGRIGAVAFRRPGAAQLAIVVAGKAVFLGWAVALPLLVFRSGWVLGLFLLGAAVLGIVLSVVFQLAHTVPGAYFAAAGPGDKVMPTSWAEHQVRTTADFAPHSRLVSWYVGGLNFQVEHHLFPDVCHLHYPALAPMVRAACAAHGLPYQVQASLRDAVAAHYRLLRALGRGGEREIAR